MIYIGDTMKRTKLLLSLAFLMFLYIGPSIFAMSAYGSTTPTQPNTSKEFTLADGEGWYDETFHYRKSVLIKPFVEYPAGTNYQVEIPVTYDAHMQADFDDVRFTDNDGNTSLDYWRESYVDSTSAIFWVKVADELNAPVTIYMYYGNSSVSTTSNGTATFLFFDDFNDASFDTDKWTVQAGNESETGGYLVLTGAATGVYISGDTSFSTDVAFGVRSYGNQDTLHSVRMFPSTCQIPYSFDDMNDLYTHYGSGADEVYFRTRDEDANGGDSDDVTLVYDAWANYELTWDVGTESKLYQDGTLKATRNDNVPDDAQSFVFSGSTTVDDDAYIDWTYVRNWMHDEPYFDSFGSEENNLPPPEWNNGIGLIVFLFNVPYDMWPLNFGLIFLGLFMIPASTVYMAKGGLKEVSTDKIFFALVIFILGWAFFIGGIFA